MTLLCDADSASVHRVPRGPMLLALQIPECYVRPIVKSWHATESDLSLLSSLVTFHNQQYTTLVSLSLSSQSDNCRWFLAGNILYTLFIIYLMTLGSGIVWSGILSTIRSGFSRMCFDPWEGQQTALLQNAQTCTLTHLASYSVATKSSFRWSKVVGE